MSCHPNAGLPNEFGGVRPVSRRDGANDRRVRAGRVSSTSSGGCCGTTPDHIAAIAEAVEGVHARGSRPVIAVRTRLAGLEPVTIGPESLFVNVGERTNVTGSARFARLIRDGDFEAGLDVARQQVRERRPDHRRQHGRGHARRRSGMVRFLNLIASEPDIARVPVMIDSSKLGGDRGRAEVRAGQGGRELDQPQGRRRTHSGSRRAWRAATGRRSWSWPSTRSGQADTADGARSRSARAPTSILVDGGGLPARGHHLRPQHLRGRDGDRRAQRATRPTSSRPRATIKESPAPLPW